MLRLPPGLAMNAHPTNTPVCPHRWAALEPVTSGGMPLKSCSKIRAYPAGSLGLPVGGGGTLVRLVGCPPQPAIAAAAASTVSTATVRAPMVPRDLAATMALPV